MSDLVDPELLAALPAVLAGSAAVSVAARAARIEWLRRVTR